jgi:hypothetical protein
MNSQSNLILQSEWQWNDISLNNLQRANEGSKPDRFSVAG